MTTDTKKPIANSMVVLREEFDDWAVLFDPDTGNAFGLNPVSVLVWKCLDGKHSVEDIVKVVREKCEGVPDEVDKDVNDYVQSLVEKGFAGYEA
jgi:SynChlorMet cassette protein ScmD